MTTIYVPVRVLHESILDHGLLMIHDCTRQRTNCGETYFFYYVDTFIFLQLQLGNTSTESHTYCGLDRKMMFQKIVFQLDVVLCCHFPYFIVFFFMISQTTQSSSSFVKFIMFLCIYILWYQEKYDFLYFQSSSFVLMFSTQYKMRVSC